MAYELRAYWERDNRFQTDRIEVYDFNGWTGLVTELGTAEEGFRFYHAEITDKDSKGYISPINDVLQVGNLEFPIRVNTTIVETLLDDIIGANETRFKIVWKIDGVINWQGYIKTRVINYPEKANYIVRLKASDFDYLKGLDFTPGTTLPTDRQTIITTIAELLGDMDFGYNIETRTSWVETNITSTTDFLSQVYHDTYQLREVSRSGNEEDQAITVFDALNRIGCALRIFQWGGQWNVWQFSAFADPTQVYVTEYDSTGSVVTATTSTDVRQTLGSSFEDGSVWVKNSSANSNYPAIKSARVVFEHNSYYSVLTLPFTTTIDGAGSETFTGTLFSTGDQTVRLSGTIRLYDTLNETSGDAFLKIVAGQYYWNGTVWTTTDTQITYNVSGGGFQDDEGNYYYDGSFNINTAPIPADATATFQVIFYNGNINASPDVVADQTIFDNVDFAIIGATAEANSTSIEYQLTQVDAFSEIYQMPDQYFGDGPSASSRSALRYSIANSDVTSQWNRRGLGTADRTYFENFLKDLMDFQRSKARRMEAEIWGAYDPLSASNYNSNTFVYVGGEYKGGRYFPTLFRINEQTAGTDSFDTVNKYTINGVPVNRSVSQGVDLATANATYLLKSSNLSDLANPATARANLSLGSSNTPTFAGLGLTGTLGMGGNRITGLGTPTASDDATTKQYVDNLFAGGTDNNDFLDGATYNSSNGVITFTVGSQADVTLNLPFGSTETPTFSGLKVFNDINTVGSQVGVDFDLDDSGGNQTTYAQVRAEIDDNTNGSEDGFLRFYTMVAGTLTNVATFTPSIISFANPINNPEFTGTTFTVGINGAEFTQGLDITNGLTVDTVDTTGNIVVAKANPSLWLQNQTENQADSGKIDFTEDAGAFGTTGGFGFRIKMDGIANNLIIQGGAQTTVNDHVTIDRDTGNTILGGTLNVDGTSTVLTGTLTMDYAGTNLFATVLAPINRDLRFELQDNDDGDSFEFRNTEGTVLFNIPRNGAITGSGSLNMSSYVEGGNLRLTGNTLSAQNTNGNIALEPNGTGLIQVIDSGFVIKKSTRTFTTERAEMYFDVGASRRWGVQIGDDASVRNYIELRENNSPGTQVIELGLNDTPVYSIELTGVTVDLPDGASAIHYYDGSSRLVYDEGGVNLQGNYINLRGSEQATQEAENVRMQLDGGLNLNFHFTSFGRHHGLLFDCYYANSTTRTGLNSALTTDGNIFADGGFTSNSHRPGLITYHANANQFEFAVADTAENADGSALTMEQLMTLDFTGGMTLTSRDDRRASVLTLDSNESTTAADYYLEYSTASGSNQARLGFLSSADTSFYVEAVGNIVLSPNSTVDINGAVAISGVTTIENDLRVSESGESIRIQGTGEDNATDNYYLSFRSSGGTRHGYVGMGSTGNNDIYIVSDTGDVRVTASSGTIRLQDPTVVTGSVTLDNVLRVDGSAPAVFLVESGNANENAYLVTDSGSFQVQERTDAGGFVSTRFSVNFNVGEIGTNLPINSGASGINAFAGDIELEGGSDLRLGFGGSVYGYIRGDGTNGLIIDGNGAVDNISVRTAGVGAFTVDSAGNLNLVNDNRLIFLGASTGSSGSGILYEDSGGTTRYAMRFISNTTIISNRASNGTVQIYANTGTSGSGGETLVVTFEDTIADFAQPVYAPNFYFN
nr:hypothetical protein 11 [bacterium]